MCRQNGGEMMPSSLSLRSPNIHTSLAVVNRLKLMDSGAIHLIGNRVTDAAEKWQIKTQPADLLMFCSPNECLKRVAPKAERLSYLCSIPHPRCIGTDRSLPVSRNREQQLICSGPRCLCDHRERNTDGLQVNMSVSIVT